MKRSQKKIGAFAPKFQVFYLQLDQIPTFEILRERERERERGRERERERGARGRGRERVLNTKMNSIGGTVMKL